MNPFVPKKKNIEITFIEQNVIIIKGERWHNHNHEFQEIKSLLISNGKKLDKILKAVGTPDNDAQLRQQIFDNLVKLNEDIKKTV